MLSDVLSTADLGAEETVEMDVSMESSLWEASAVVRGEPLRQRSEKPVLEPKESTDFVVPSDTEKQKGMALKKCK